MTRAAQQRAQFCHSTHEFEQLDLLWHKILLMILRDTCQEIIKNKSGRASAITLDAFSNKRMNFACK